MTGQQLRDSILLEAIQGHILPQNPSDEPAIKILERIRDEKKALVKSGIIKKKDLEVAPILPEEIPFDKPRGWEFARLSDLSLDSADGPFGSNLKKDHYTTEKQVRIIQLSNIGGLGWRDSNVKYTTFEHLKTISRSEAFAGDVIIAKMMPAGRAIICPDTDKKFVLSSDAVRFDFSSFLNKRYLYYAINSPVFRDQVYSEVQGITRVRTSLNKLRTYILPIPPLSEQKRIVEKIEELLPLIDEYDKAAVELETLNKILPDKLRKSVLQEAIHGTLVPNDIPEGEATGAELLQQILKERQEKEDKEKGKKAKKLTLSTIEEEPWDLPEGWCWCKLSDLFNIVSARRVHQSDWRTSGIPFYRTREIGWLAENRTDVKPELYIEESLYERFKQSGYPSPGDIMMTAVGTVGKTYIVQPEDKFYYKDASVLCLENISKVNPKYICYVIASDFFKSMIAEEAMGTTVATITMVRANEYIVPLPPLSIQHRIVEKIEELFSAINKLPA